MKRLKAIGAALGFAALVILAVACGADEPLASEYVPGLLQDLRAAGIAAEELAGPNAKLRFSIEGKGLAVNDGIIHVFAFPDPATADTEASYVSDDGWTIRVPQDGGRTGTTIYEWVATPHYYKKAELIVLYIGDDEVVIDTLVEVVGPQFAGQ